jgi:hypothetical protein
MPDQLLHVGAPPLKSKYFVLSRILTDKLFGLRDDPPPSSWGMHRCLLHSNAGFALMSVKGWWRRRQIPE